MHRSLCAVTFHPPNCGRCALGACSTSVHFIHISNEPNLIAKKRQRTSALNVSDKSHDARSLDDSMRDFLQISSSTQRSQLVAMDAIRLIKLCRTNLQSSRIAVIWPCIVFKNWSSSRKRKAGQYNSVCLCRAISI